MKLLQKFKSLAGALILLAGFGCPMPGLAQDLPLYEENTLYVKFKDNSEISAKKMLSGKNGEKTIATNLLGFSSNLINRFKIQPNALSMSLFENPVLDKTFMITVDPAAKADIEQLMEELEKNPSVEYVERVPFNRIYSTPSKSETPVNDPFFGKIADGSMNVSWHLDLINAEKAWELQTGNPAIRVAVVDNAIWGAHEDLQIPNTQQYNCVEKRVGNAAPPVNQAIQDAQCAMPDLYNNGCTAYDFSHGTHCAGAIAAINNNGIGIASIGSGVSLVGVAGPNVQNPIGVYNSYHGVEWAADKTHGGGAKLISCSWGSDAHAATNEAVMKACYDQGVIVVAAAGNDNINPPHYPAAYSPYVISVGSVDANRQKSSFSNYGYWIDMLSPGGEDTTEYKTQIFSTTFCQNQYTRLFGNREEFTGKYYDEMSGTSMATPVLAGVVALMLSKDSTLTTDQVRAILQNSGQDLVAGNGRYNSYCKIVDAYAALKCLEGKPVFGNRLPKNHISTKSEHDSVWLDWKSTDPNVTAYRIYRNGTVVAESISDFTLRYDTLQADTALIIDSVRMYSFLDTNLAVGTFRYAIEPLYGNAEIYSIKTEIDVTVKRYYTIAALIRPDSTFGHIEGTGEYELRQLYTLKAIPSENCKFEYWTDETGTKMYGATISGPVLKNRRFFAYFNYQDQNESLNQLETALHISPNPASDEVTVQCADYEISRIRITNLQGRIVYDAACKTHKQTIGIGHWNNGTYLIQVTTDAGIVSQKLIKQ